MARARNIKTGFFKNEDLAECSPWARLLFIGLWQLADREGRLEDRPKRIKAELFAFDSIDAEPLLAELERFGFVLRYQVKDMRLIQVVNFAKHQNPHHREPASEFPPPASMPERTANRRQRFARGARQPRAGRGPAASPSAWNALRTKVFERDGHRCVYCGSAEDLECDHVHPRARGGTDALENLATACKPCNTSKGAKTLAEWKGVRHA
ncbi:HNH endonuclease [Azohydromonas aeria]|uniref:HNH endonuclease n=1 Tax=Azohydromonas aeria TaxID=2590212 RepID=UPI0018DF6E10|nr:HNH endonuclease [Azohydromonas aeria]